MSSLNMKKQLIYKLLNTIFLLILKYPSVADVIYIIPEREQGCQALGGDRTSRWVEERAVLVSWPWAHTASSSLQCSDITVWFPKKCYQTEASFCKFKCRGMSDSMQFDLLTCSLLRTPGWAPYQVGSTTLHAWGWPWPRSASLGLQPGTHVSICSQESYWLRGMFYWASSLCDIHDEQTWAGLWSPTPQK